LFNNYHHAGSELALRFGHEMKHHDPGVIFHGAELPLGVTTGT
jgi:hypothetical protein